MYFIINKTKRAISIEDMNFVIGPKKGVDLEKYRNIQEIEKSSMLKSYLKQGVIERRKETKKHKKHEDTVENKLNPVVSVDQLREEFKKDIKEALLNIKIEQPSQSVPSELVQVLTELAKSLNNQKSQQGIPVFNQEKTDIDDKTMEKIQQKTVERLTKNVESHMTYIENQMEEDDDNWEDDLKDLIRR